MSDLLKQSDTDAYGYPKRHAGQRFSINGRRFTIIKNLGLMVLCPCPDNLLVHFDDAVNQEIIENSNQFQTTY